MFLLYLNNRKMTLCAKFGGDFLLEFKSAVALVPAYIDSVFYQISQQKSLRQVSAKVQ